MKVERLIVGWFHGAAGVFRRGDDMDRQVRFPVPAYVIETDSERVLVDTGLDPSAIADPVSHYGSDFGFRLEQDSSVADQVDLGSLTRVVLTHLHFDHAGGLSLLPAGLPIVCQRREWLAGAEEAAIKRNFFRPSDYDGIADQIVLVDGDHDLLGDGSIRLLLTPGHTPGHQSVQIGDSLVLGIDVAPFASALDDHRFPVFGDDHDAQAESADRLRALRDGGAVVLPGHDPELVSAGPIAL